MRNVGRSISTPIILGSVAVPLAIALLVGWTLFIVRDLSQGENIAGNTWLLVLGALGFATILFVLVLFSVWIARGILEVRRQNSFIDSVTHELKSPLASLKLCLETLRREELSAEQRENLRLMMIDDVERLSSFIDDVLESSRIAWQRQSLVLADVDVGAIITHGVEVVAARHKVPPEGIDMVVAPGLNLVTDRTALEIVVRNLLDNAVKYSEGAARVEVRAERDDAGSVVVTVRDHGIGIPKKHLGRVFQRFYRVPTERVRERRGTGLGLFVVASLVRDLGGTIEAKSEGEGTGTTMRVLIPSARVSA